MTSMKKHQLITRIGWVMAILILSLYGSKAMFIVSAIFLCPVMMLRALKINDKKRFKFLLISLYLVIVIMQIIFYAGGLGTMRQMTWLAWLENVIDIFILMIPIGLEYLVTVKKYTEFYMPSVQEISTVSFGQIKAAADFAVETVNGIGQLRDQVTVERIKNIAGDLPRHSAVRYINNDSLTDAYFEAAEKSLDDPHMYIVVSSTGSDASEIISVFTRKQYNHASLAFDRDLNTIISYNGGENIYPPGLNQEMIEFFNKKKDACMMVYSLETTRGQKAAIIDRIRTINKQGSAYNMLGLVLKTSMRPNIMFCSQFVYSTLDAVGLAYFDRHDGMVKPTDLVELDYHRKLKFCYEIFLNENEANL